MPTASKVLRINGVNTGISYDIEDVSQLTRVSSNEIDNIKTPLNNGKISSKTPKGNYKIKRIRRKCLASNCQNKVCTQQPYAYSTGQQPSIEYTPQFGRCLFFPVTVLPGNLGLQVRYIQEIELAVINIVAPNCAIRNIVTEGNFIYGINGKRLKSPEHVSGGNDEARTLTIMVVLNENQQLPLPLQERIREQTLLQEQMREQYKSMQSPIYPVLNQGIMSQQDMMRAMMAQGGYAHPIQMTPNQAMMMPGQTMMQGEGQAVPVACQIPHTLVDIAKDRDEELLRQWFQTQFSHTPSAARKQQQNDNVNPAVANNVQIQAPSQQQTLPKPMGTVAQLTPVNEHSEGGEQAMDKDMPDTKQPPMMRTISDYTVDEDDDDMMGAMIYKSSNTAKKRVAEANRKAHVAEVSTLLHPELGEPKNKDIDVLIRAKIVEKLHIKLGCTVAADDGFFLGGSHGATRKGNRIGSATGGGMSGSVTDENEDGVALPHQMSKYKEVSICLLDLSLTYISILMNTILN